MPQVASVRLRYAAQDYWFDPAGVDVQKGDHVLVETSKGQEIGICTQDPTEVDEAELTSPLKTIVRIATEDDFEHAEKVAARGQEALAVFHDLVEKNKLDMNPALVEFSFDETNATFYFTSADRVDFRSLVRDLAAEFHVRVDMRQIGPRDEARMLGGLGHCGEELCCARLGGDFQQINIRMAKEQDLPLNPTKISGLCGRLMCCLRYEYEAYKDFKGRAPKRNALIETPAGMGKVVDLDTPREVIHLRMEDGTTLAVPLASMDTGGKVPHEGERIRPCHISQDVFDELMEELSNDSTLAMMGDKFFSDNPDLADTTVEGGTIEHVTRRRPQEPAPRKRTEDTGRKPRQRSSSAPATQARPERKRRRSVSVAGGEEVNQRDSEQRTNRNDGKKTRPRPGQHSSGISAESNSRNASNSANEGKSKGPGGGRRRRRRRDGGGN